MCKRLIAVVMSSLLMAALVAADEIAVTVYNNNLGVISETRSLSFDKGVHRLAFRDVPALIDPSSVTFDIENQGRNVSLLEQNYAYDLISPEKMYSRYLDQPIELVDKDGHLYSGALLSFSSQAVTLKEDNGRIKILSLGNMSEVNFPELPDGLITRPTLFWLYRSDFSGELGCHVGYQTSGMSWTAEYVGLLNKNEDRLELTGWSSITNNSGKTYKDATLKLVAGDIHRAQTPMFRGGRAKEVMMADGLARSGFEEKQFFEYHLYTLPRKATVANQEIKQISLFEPATAEVNKIFQYQPDVNPRQVRVAIKFRNSGETGLGMPLPAGRIRLFKGDDDGSMILLGEDRIKHTPKDEDVSVTVGYAFDLAAEEKLVDQRRISSSVEERTWEISLRNHKSKEVEISVEKKLYGFWKIMDSNSEYTKKDANTVEFVTKVAPDSETKIKLTVQFTTR